MRAPPQLLELGHRDELQVTIIEDEIAFESLAVPWSVLADRCSTATVFLSHEWFRAAWAWRRLDSRLYILVVRKGDAVCGILPLICGPDGNGATRRLELLTVPDTQISDLLTACGDLTGVADAIAKSLAALRSWDVLELNYLLPGGALIQGLVPALHRQGLRVDERDAGRNHYVPLTGTWSDFYNARSRSLKKANNLAANRLRKRAKVDLDWHRADISDDLKFRHVVESVISVSSRSWKHVTGNALNSAGPEAFIRTLSEGARARGWLSVWLLYLDGQPVATEYQLIDSGTVHALRSDYDTKHDDISPGSYLFRHLLESLFAAGMQRYYLGPGDNQYKLRWTDQAEPLRRVIVYNRTFRGRCAWFFDAVVKPLLRAARDRFRMLGKRQDGVLLKTGKVNED